jgi:lipid-A-disaccharide synthase
MAGSAKRILIVTGEASADRYGARLVEALHSVHGRNGFVFYGTGGDEMQKAGVHLLCHIRELAHIGPREAFTGLLTYRRTFRDLVQAAATQPPKVAVLMDFPEFNLRLAKKLKRLGIQVVYYIGPQIWAWRSGRIRTIRKYVDKMLVILPFEEEYYRKRGVDVEFVGHPLLESFEPNRNRESFLRGLNLDPARKTIAILAGSRRKEIDYILPTLLEAARHLLRDISAQFVISSAPSIEVKRIHTLTERILQGNGYRDRFRVSTLDSRDILANSDFAFVKSGTSSLEAALAGVPFLITYKISNLSWFVGSLLIRSPMKGLVNLIAEEQIVPEIFQNQATPRNLARVALDYLEKPEKSAGLRSQLACIKEKLSVRLASETVAAEISRYL